MEDLKRKARQDGLWNLFLPGVSGFSQLEYAPMAEEMGRCPFSSEVFNCSAPDTGGEGGKGGRGGEGRGGEGRGEERGCRGEGRRGCRGERREGGEGGGGGGGGR